MLVATASIRESLSSRPSSGVLGPGYYSGKAIEWLGKKCINGIEDVIIFTRCWQYHYRLKQWFSSEGNAEGHNRDKRFFAMLEDLLELSRSVFQENFRIGLIVAINRDCYSDLVQNRALDIAYRANKLALIAPSRNEKEDLTWRMSSMLCFVPM